MLRLFFTKRVSEQYAWKNGKLEKIQVEVVPERMVLQMLLLQTVCFPMYSHWVKSVQNLWSLEEGTSL